MRSLKTLALCALLLSFLVASTPAGATSAFVGGSSAMAQGHPDCAGVSYETPRTSECDAVMANQPYPDVTPVPFDLGVIADQDFVYFEVE